MTVIVASFANSAGGKPVRELVFRLRGSLFGMLNNIVFKIYHPYIFCASAMRGHGGPQPLRALSKPERGLKDIFFIHVMEPSMPTTSARVAASAEADDLVLTLVALLRADGHLCNVLTHVGSGNWGAVEAGIASILHPRTTPKQLSNVARNILQLICDGRGVTGPIMRPFVFNIIARVEGPTQMRRLKKKIWRLRHRMALEVAPDSQEPRGNAVPAVIRANAHGDGKTCIPAVNGTLRDKQAPIGKIKFISDIRRTAA